MAIETDFKIMVMSKGGYSRLDLREMDRGDYEYLCNVANQWEERLYPTNSGTP